MRDEIGMVMEKMARDLVYVSTGDESSPEHEREPTLTQWEENDGSFRGIGKTRKEIPPGLYRISISQQGLFFDKKNTSTNDLIRFEDSSVDEIMKEIDIFWKSRDKYKKFDVQYKRGILMHGPPGSGKSSIIKILIRDVVSRGGVAIDFEDCRAFEYGMDVFRKIHPKKPVVCIMEDIESIMRSESPSTILNVLDGSTNFMDNIVFVATSNYPELLEERITDRPSRFDRVIEVGLPSAEMRKVYLTHLFKNAKISVRPVKKWVKDTEGLTFPHLQEMFLSVNLYDIDYEEAINRVKGMSKNLSSDKHRRKSLGGGFADMFETPRALVEYDDEESFIKR